MNQFREFMQGRYGLDTLSFAFVIFSVVLSLVLGMFPVGMARLVSYIPLGLAFYRMLSKDICTRQRENEIFLKYWWKVRNWFKKISKDFKDHQEYKYFKCPNCKQKLRAPRGRGKIRVTCQRCQKDFIKKV